MRVYYRGRDALVTSEHLVWYTTPPQTFAVRRLSGVCIVRADRPGGTGPARLGAAPLAVAAGTAPGRPLLLAVGALALAAPVVVAVVQRRLRPREWRLRATYGGRTVVVYASTDARVFNQVARALWRALEDSGPVTPRDLAVA